VLGQTPFYVRTNLSCRGSVQATLDLRGELMTAWHKDRDAATARIHAMLAGGRLAVHEELHDTLLDMDCFSSDGEVQRLGAVLLRGTPSLHLPKKGATLSRWAHSLLRALSRHSPRRSPWAEEDTTPGALRVMSTSRAGDRYPISLTHQLLQASLHVFQAIWVENPHQGPACSGRMTRILTKVASSITPNAIYLTHESTGAKYRRVKVQMVGAEILRGLLQHICKETLFFLSRDDIIREWCTTLHVWMKPGPR